MPKMKIAIVEDSKVQVRLSDYVADFLVKNNVTDVFMVTGGGAMHLDDALGHNGNLNCIFNHHEQACSIAAEGYARLSGKIAAVCVTSGPGGTNAITGVLGGWQDSIPMFVVSGQVKRETTTWSTDVPLRQLGDQEFQIVECVRGMTKYAVMVTEPSEIRYHLEKAWYLATTGRKGPVWIDIPLDVQSSKIEVDKLKGFNPSDEGLESKPTYDDSFTKKIVEKIKEAHRPVVLAGTGIRLGDAHKEFLEVVHKLNIPVVTAWNAHDVIENEDPLYCGRPSTVGNRGGNFVVQNADLLVSLGCRLNIRQISYNYRDFAKDAYKIVVDIDAAELIKPTINVDMPINADVKDVLKALNSYLDIDSVGDHSKWLEWCRVINERYPVVLPEYRKTVTLNPYVFLQEMYRELSEGDVIITGNGSACVMGFQSAVIKKGQRLFTNSGCAAMGYGFPAAIGACFTRNGERVICLDGDGSFQMNIQELQTVVQNNLNLKIVILNNNGYHSIRQTQTNLFKPPFIGISAESGISFPDMEKIAYAYGIPYVKVDGLEGINGRLKKWINTAGPVILEAIVDEGQIFSPKLSSKVMPDGTIVSPSLDDMYPFLPKEEYEDIKNSARMIR